jgi:circadian clock protein KaiB
MSESFSSEPDKASVAVKGPVKERHQLTLYVAGLSTLSRRAIVNTRRICDDHLKSYHLTIVDLCQDPHLASSEQIVAAPTLVRTWPEPIRRFVGDMSRTEVIVQRLGLSEDSIDSNPF